MHSYKNKLIYLIFNSSSFLLLVCLNKDGLDSYGHFINPTTHNLLPGVSGRANWGMK